MTLRSRSLLALLGPLWMVGVFVFMLAPLVVVVGASFNGDNASFIHFPPREFSLVWYGRIDPAQLRALGISVMLGALAAVFAVLLGVPAAIGLVRSQFRGKAMVAALLRSPLQIPAVVIGVSFLKLYFVVGEATGVGLVGSFAGLLVGHVFMSTPYVIGSVAAVLQRFNMRLEEAALSLGASRWRVFRRVTLPVVMPGVYTGAIYAFLVSFGDVPVSLFLGASGMTSFPVELFHAMEFDFNPSVLAISTLVILGSGAVMVVLQRAVGLGALLRSGGSP